MKKLLLLSLLFLAGCSDRYDFVREIEKQFPGTNAEHFLRDVYIVTYNNKSVIIDTAHTKYIKTINTQPEEDGNFVRGDEFVKELKKRLNYIDKMEK